MTTDAQSSKGVVNDPLAASMPSTDVNVVHGNLETYLEKPNKRRAAKRGSRYQASAAQPGKSEVDAEIAPTASALSTTNEKPQGAFHVLLLAISEDYRQTMSAQLSDAQFHVLSIASISEVLEELAKGATDLLLMANDVPEASALQLCRTVRDSADPQFSSVPVVMLGHWCVKQQVITAMQSGVDEYLTGPYLEADIMHARLRAIIDISQRNSRGKDDTRTTAPMLGSKDLRIDPDSMAVWVNDQRINLTSTPFRLLLALARKPGHVYDVVTLARMSSRASFDVSSSSVKSHIHLLRRQLGSASNHIKTVRGVGYTFDVPSVDQ